VAPGRRARVDHAARVLVGKVRGWMLMLLGAVVLVLLIACANVANLMLVRARPGAAARWGSAAALGASPWRLVRGLLVEGIVLSLAGAMLGLALASVGIRILRAWLPAGLPRVASIGIDMRVLAAATTAAVVTGIVFGIIPALQSARPDLAAALKEGGRSATAGGRAQRLRSILVVAEVALAVILLVGAGLFTSSFVRLMRVDPGFDYHHVIALNIGLRLLPGEKIRRRVRGAQRVYAQQVIDAVSRVPGAEMVAMVGGGFRSTGSWSRTSVTLPGRGEAERRRGRHRSRTVTRTTCR
jgi:hypothetical protein